MTARPREPSTAAAVRWMRDSRDATASTARERLVRDGAPRSASGRRARQRGAAAGRDASRGAGFRVLGHDTDAARVAA